MQDKDQTDDYSGDLQMVRSSYWAIVGEALPARQLLVAVLVTTDRAVRLNDSYA